MKVEVAVLISPSLMSLTVSVDVKQHWVELPGVCQSRAESRFGLAVRR